MRKNYTLLKQCAVALFMVIVGSSSAFAQSAGFNSSYAVFSINGGADAFYCMPSNTSCGVNPALSGASLGSFTIGTGTLVLKGAEHNVFKCGGADITGTNLNYRIYKTSATPGSFIVSSIGFLSGTANGCGGEDQQWKDLTKNINVLNTLAPGNYTIEIFSDAATTLGTQFLSNSSANYKATFTVNSGTNPVVVNATGGTTFATYLTLSAAFTAINGGTHTGTVTITIGGNTTEPAGGAVINASGSGSASYTALSVQPFGAITITGAATAGSTLIDFNGADNVTINGLNSSGNSLTISNTTSSATSGTSTIRFIGGATSNTITNCSVLGSFSAAVGTNGGNIFFSTDAITANGNDNNIISNCNIAPAGANLPTKGIYMNGSTSTTAIGNSGNTFTNNNISDYFGAAVSSAGIYISGGNTDNNITNNKFYQSATRTQTTGAQHSAIWITNTSGNNFLVSGNTIGFATNLGTGTYNFVAVSSTSVLIPIFLNVGTTTSTSIQGNTIAGIAMSGAGSGTSSSAAFRGIYVSSGLTNIGDVTGNTVGNMSATGSITYTSNSTSASDVIGIFNFGSSNWTTNNNLIGGITGANSSTGATNVYGLRCNTGSTVTWTCNSNTVGGTIANSMQSTSTATGTVVNGILNNNPIGTFTGNTIRNLTAVGGTGTTTSASVIGICITSSSANHTVSQNIIHSLSNTNSASATTVCGIQYIASTGTNLVSRNFIHSLNNASVTGIINGINVSGGTTTYQNNMIRLGVDASGADITTGCAINGISEPLGTDNFYFNSVYIGGSGVGGTSSTFAFNSTQTINTRSFRNNIFVNARSNSAGTGKHYAVQVGGTAANPTGLTIDYNDYLVTGTGGVFGRFNSLDVANLAAWKIAVGQDANSINSDPSFVAPNGTSSTVDLHVNNTSPVEAIGIAIGTVTDDFDGQTRSTLTPTDIGADAFIGTTCAVAVGGTISPSTAIGCVGLTYAMSTTGSTTGNGISYQWEISTTGGGVGFGDVVSGSGATTTSYTTASLTAGTYYYRLKVTCSAIPGSPGYSNELTLTVNTVPMVTVNPTSGSYCSPGGTAVALTAINGTTYTWAPAAGLDVTTGATVNASPSTTTTYTVTGTSASCSATATAAITVGASVTVTASATPSSVCSGNNSQLLASPSQSFTTPLANSYGFAGSTGAGYSVITGITLGAGAIGDDVGIGNLPIGFSFNYNGTNHTIFGARSNGLIELDQASATLSSFSNNALASTANCIAPLWDDNNTTGGSIIYATTGAVGSRVLTVQWTGMHVGGSGGSSQPTINMQVKLYEGSNKIEFIYGSTSAPFTTTTASIGISGASGNFVSVTPLSPPNTSTKSTVTENTSISSATNFPSGTVYTFTPAGAPIFTYSWTPSSFIAGQETLSNPVATAVTSTTTYTVTTTGNAGCAASATATVSLAAAMSVAVNSPTICSGNSATLTAVVTGGAPMFTYTWAPSAGITPTTGVSVTANPTTATTYTVTATDACGTIATGTSNVIVNPTPSASISPAGPVNTCSVGTQVLTASTNAVSPTYQWKLGAATISGATNSTYTPISSGSYTVVVTDGSCNGTSAAVSVTVNQSPGTVTVTPSSPTICSGGSVGLTASGGTVGGTANATLGTGTSLTSASAQPTAFCNRYSQYWNQTIYTQAELLAAGLSAGSQISAVTYTTTTQGDAANNTNFSIYIGNTGSSTLSAFQTTGMSLVYGPTSYTHTVGSNTIPFNNSFTWNGSSNIILEVRQDGVDALNNAITFFTAASDNKNIEAHTSTTSGTTTLQALVASASVTPTASTTRLNIVFAYSSVVNPSWTWAPSMGITPTTGASVTASPAATQTYTATATVNGCTSTGTSTVNVSNLAVLASAQSDPSCFNGTNGSITASGSGGTGGPYQYAIDGGSLSPASLFSGLASGLHVLTVNDGFCSATVNVTLTNPTQVTVSITGSTSPTCHDGTDGSITASASGGTGAGYTYTLDGGASNSTGVFTGVSAGSHAIVATDGNSCASSATPVTLTNPAALAVSASNDGPVCDGGNVSLTATSGFVSYAWAGTGISSPSANPTTVTGLTPNGTYTYTVTVSDGTCSNTATTTVTVNSNLPVSVVASTPNTTICSASPVTFTATPTNGGGSPAYQWYLNGAPISGETNASYSTSSIVDQDEVWVVLTSNATCATGNPATSNHVVMTVSGSVTASITISTTSPTTICAGTSVTFTSTTTGGVGTYQWNNGGLPISGETNSSYTTTTLANGDMISCDFAAASSCATPNPASSNTITMMVNPSPAVPVISASGPLTFCGPGSVKLWSQYSGPGILWSTGATTDTITVSSSNPSITITYTVAGCSATSAPTAVTVNNASALITPSSSTVCAGGTVTLTASATPAATSYLWSPGGATTSTITAGAGTYTVTTTDGNGCTAMASAMVTENAAPTVTVSATCTTFFTGGNVTLTANATAGSGTIATYQWKESGNAIGGATNSTYTTSTAGSYTVTVTNTNTCSTTSTPPVVLTLLSGALAAGTYDIPSSCGFATIAAAVTYINNNGVSGSGNVIFDIGAGITYNETATAGGFSITATGTSTLGIIFRKSVTATGPVTVTASASLTAGALNDGIFKLIGADYITFDGLTLNENAANIITTAASNNMTEWGIAALYATTTDGAQNTTIKNCTITLNRIYQNTFGIYSNATHTASSVTTSATATTAAGANSGLKVYGNNISNVNCGIIVVGPTAAADANTGIDIGGTGGIQANTITNYGTTGTFSGYANVSGTVNGILVRNSITVNISFNTITSSNGGTTAGTLNGIQVPASSNAPTATFTNTINGNIISLRSAVASGAITGISYPGGSASATSTLNVNANDFNTFGHTVAGSGTITFITIASTNQFTTINNNTFTNMSVNTTGGITFIAQSFTAPATGTKNVNSNSIVTGFTKSGAGGTINFILDNGSSVSGAISNCQNNNFSNVTLTGATAITGISFTDGGTAPTRTVTGNILNNWTTGASTINAMNFTYWNGVSILTNNTITNINGQSAITGITLGSSANAATSVSISSNTITGLSSTGTGGTVTGITCSNTSPLINISSNIIGALSTTGSSSTVLGIGITGATLTNVSSNTISGLSGSGAGSPVANGISISSGTTVNVFKNKIYDISESGATPLINGTVISGGTTVTFHNNLIGDLRTPAATSNIAINGLQVSGSTTANIYYNTININATSLSATTFGNNAFYISSTTPSVTSRNNIFVNTSTPGVTGGYVAAFRYISAPTSTYNSASNNNLFWVGATAANVVLYGEGSGAAAANGKTTLAAYKSYIGSRDAASVSEAPNFLSTSGASANFLHIDPTIATQIESGAANVTGITDDYDNNIRAGNPGYTGSGVSPDIGADEFEGILNDLTGPAITYTPIGAACVPDQTLTANISDGTGVPTTGSLVPRIYYKKNGGSYFSQPGTLSSGTALSGTWSFNIVSSDFGGATLGDVISYYVIAQDVVATPNISSNPSGVVATDVNTVTSPPASPNTYTISSSTVTAVATATPASICNGASSSLSATASKPGVSTANNYNFAATSGATLDPMTGATQVLGSSDDDTPTGAPASIGFTFSFEGNNYSQYSVSPDGWLLLGSATAASSFTNTTTLSSNIPKLFPYWDDLATGSDGNVKVLVTGSSPNRIFKVQWLVTVPRNTTGAANSTFQAWLYEGSNKIEYRYGTMGVNTTSVSVGMTGSIATNFNSVTISTGTSSSVTANDGQIATPAIGTMYTFTPPVFAINNFTWAPAASLVSTTGSPVATMPLTVTTTFTVTATDASTGCTATATATVSVGAPLSVSVNSATICAGNSTNLTATTTGGGAPFTYSWDPPTGLSATSGQTVSANPTATTTYTVTVLDNCGASTTGSGTITVNPSPTFAATPSSGLICGGGNVTIVASSANPSPVFTWSPAAGLNVTTGSTVVATPSLTTTYTVSDGLCTSSFTVTVAGAVTVSATATPSAICTGGTSSLQSTASQSGLAYTLAGLTGQTYTTLSGGGITIVNTTAQLTAGFSTASQDDGGLLINLPFTFNYLGSSFTQMSMSTNGWISPGSAMSTITAGPDRTAGNLFSTNLPNNTIAAWFKDMGANFPLGAGSMRHGLVGTDVYAFQWDKAVGSGFSDGATITISFQINVYGPASSSPGKIQVLYGPAVGAISFGASIGGEDATGGPGHYVNALDGSSTSTTTSTVWPGDGNGYSFTPATLNYAWAPAASVVNPSAQNTLTNPLSTTTTFTVTATASSGCAATANVTVSTDPLTGLTVNSPTICVGSGATLTAVPTGGGSPYTYTWAPGTNLSATNGMSVTANPPATTVYTVTVTDACMNSTSATSTVTVLSAPTVNSSPSYSVLCSSGSVVLTASGNATSYTWAPSAGLSATTGTSVTASPTVTTIYTVTGSNGTCATSKNDTIVVGIIGMVTASANPANICAGGTSTLVATSGNFAAGDVTLGSDNATSKISTVGTPYRTGTTTGVSIRSQYLILASELTNAGIIAGNINSLGLFVTNAPTGFISNMVISMGNTGATAMTTTFLTDPVSQVYTIATWTPVTGLNNHPFQTSFNWNGTSNILINICGDLTVAGSGSGTTLQTFTTPFLSTLANNTTCSVTTGTTPISTGTRPVFRFNAVTGVNTTASNNWVWNPGNLTGSTVNVMPAATTTYTVTATYPSTNCTSTATTTVTVGAPLAASVNSATICAGLSTTLTATVSGGGSPYGYVWSPGGQTTSTITVSPASTTTYSVTVTDFCGGSIVASGTVTVNPLPMVAVTPTNPSVCSGGSGTLLTASGASTYTWTPATGLTPTTGAAVTANPTVSTTYTVTGTNANGCVSTAPVFVSVLTAPSITSVTANPANTCSGGSSVLTATAFQAGTLVNSYSKSNLSGQTYSTLSGAGITVINTAAQLTPGMGGATQDDGGIVIPIPFTFTYNGNNFNTMSMCTNGWVGAGDWGTIDAVSMRAAANLFTSTIPNNTIAAWFKDMGANFPGGTGSMRHGLVGTGVYAFQWDNAVGSGFSDAATILISFQINIYGPASANPGRIEIIYGPTVGTISFAASEGIEDATGGANHYINALDGSGTSTTTSTAWPGNGNGYRFDPLPPSALTYAWTPSASITNPSANPATANNITSTTTYTVTVTNSGGCSATGSVQVGVIDADASFFGLNADYCVDQGLVQIFPTQPGGVISGAGTYNFPPDYYFDPSAAGLGAHYIKYTTLLGCASDSQLVTVHALPTVTLSPIPNVCQNGPSFTLSSGSPSGGIYSIDNGPFITEFDPSLYSSGSHMVTYLYIDSFGCGGSADGTIYIALPSAPTSFSVTNCDSYTLPWGGTVTSSGAYTYTYMNAAGCDSVVTANVTINTCSVAFDATFFIQGYMDEFNPGFMKSVMVNQGLVGASDPNEVDTVMIVLHDAVTYAPVDTFKGILYIDGKVNCYFSHVSGTGSYFISIHYKNTLETWSAAAVSMSAGAYDFSSDLTQAYPDPFNPNPQMTYIAAAGVWAVYSGDVNQDGQIAGDDFNIVEFDVTGQAFGYNSTDITGDGPTDGADFNLLETNVSLGLFVAHP